LSVSSIASTNSSSTNSSLSQSPNSTTSQYATPLLHSSPIRKQQLQYCLESTNIESESDAYSEPFDNLNHSEKPNLNRLVSPVHSNTIQNISRHRQMPAPPKKPLPAPPAARLFYNFNNNSNNLAMSLPGTPLHNVHHKLKPNKKYQYIYAADSLSVPSSPSYPRRPNNSTAKQQQHQQPVIKMLKQTASKLTDSVTGSCGGMLGTSSLQHSTSSSSIGYSRRLGAADQPAIPKKESLLNRFFKRSKSKDVPAVQGNKKNNGDFNHHQAHVGGLNEEAYVRRTNACFSLSVGSSVRRVPTDMNENGRLVGVRTTICNENSSSGYESFINESQDEASECTVSNTGYFNGPVEKALTLQRTKTEKIC